MALRKRNGIWQIDLIHEGKRIREPTGTADEKLAKIKYAEMQSALYRGTFVSSKDAGGHGGYTVARAFDRACEGSWMEDMKPSTVKAAHDCYRQLTRGEWLKSDTPVSALTEHTLEKLRSQMLREAGIKRGTVNRRMWVVRAILAQAKKDGAIKTIPPVPKNLKESDAAKRRNLTAEEEVQVLEYLSADDAFVELRDAFVLLMDTGARLGEIVYLTKGDVDFEHNRVLFRDPKNGEARGVPMTARMHAILKRRLEGARMVFTVPDGFAPSYWTFRLDKDWEKVRAALGMGKDVVLHCVRHTTGTRLMSMGYDTRTVMDFLGHKTPTMTLRYSHGLTERIREASSALESFAQRAVAQRESQQG